MEYWGNEQRHLVRYFITPILHCPIFFTGFPLASVVSRQATETQGPTA